jgi:hypothetical protein
MQAYSKNVANILAPISASVEFGVCYLLNMVHSGGWNMVILHQLPVPPAVSMLGSISIIMPSLWDYNRKRPEGPKSISPRCQPWVGSETSKVPEAQDDFIDECVFASGMKTDDRVFTVIANARLRLSNLSQGRQLFIETELSF